MAIKVYGTTQCPDTRECLAQFEEKNIPVEFLDIEKLENLKEFLRIRDREPIYDEVKANGGVGIPLLEIDGSYTFDF